MKTLVTYLSIAACLSTAFVRKGYSLELHPLFSDNAVLQQELPVPVWGTSTPGEEVVIEFAGQEKKTTVNAEGNWIAVLDPLVASAEPKNLAVSSSSGKISVENVLVGEVWIGSGQSNMAMSVSGTLTADETAGAAEKGGYDGVRLFKVPIDGSDDPMTTVNAAWALPTPDNVARFSATAFYFAARLAKDLAVPVGIIQSANGGTNAFSWINNETLANDHAAAAVRTYWEAAVKNHPAALELYSTSLAKWREKAAEAKKKGETLAGRAPREPIGPEHVKRPTGHYNAMVAPLQPFAIRGVVWYQGEANSREPFHRGYRDLMLALAEDWRGDWASAAKEAGAEGIERRDFPFYLVQLPNFAGGDPEGWPIIREQMLKFWQEGTNTGMVVAIDKGEPKDIHPRDKKPVGERLSLFARANAYGENIVFSGPIYDSIEIEGENVIVAFTETGSGLASLDGKPLAHFEIAGSAG